MFSAPFCSLFLDVRRRFSSRGNNTGNVASVTLAVLPSGHMVLGHMRLTSTAITSPLNYVSTYFAFRSSGPFVSRAATYCWGVEWIAGKEKVQRRGRQASRSFAQTIHSAFMNDANDAMEDGKSPRRGEGGAFVVDEAREVLRSLFGHPDFRDGQVANETGWMWERGCAVGNLVFSPRLACKQ